MTPRQERRLRNAEYNEANKKEVKDGKSTDDTKRTTDKTKGAA